jgi:hypothetical protein
VPTGSAVDQTTGHHANGKRLTPFRSASLKKGKRATTTFPSSLPNRLACGGGEG